MLLILTRRVKSNILGQGRLYSQEVKKFNILYMGRDEFSCGVFRELYAAPGVS
jgi:methionyl-tRNA formyltransferase